MAGVPDAPAILAKPGGLRQNTPAILAKPGGLRQNTPAIGVKPGGLKQNTPAIGIKPGGLEQNTPAIGGKPGGLRQNTPAIGSNQVVWSKTHTRFASNSWFEGFRGCQGHLPRLLGTSNVHTGPTSPAAEAAPADLI